MVQYLSFIAFLVSAATSAIKLFFVALVVALVSLAAYIIVISQQLPSTQELSLDNEHLRNRAVNYEDLPPSTVSAFLAAEDARFFEHRGIDYRALLRALALSAEAGEFSNGGSTITMQLAKNLFLGTDKTLSRKLSQLILAHKLEARYSKAEILEAYLGVIYFGNGIYGLSSAANHYFGKPLEELELQEIAVLAGIPKAPSKYNPMASQSAALHRRNWVLQRMKVNQLINEAQFQNASASTIL